MQIYARLTGDGVVEEISAEAKDFFRLYSCSDSDIFKNFMFFRENENHELVLDTSRYTRLGEHQFVFIEGNEGFSYLMKEEISHLDTKIVTITPEEFINLIDVNWYDYDPINKKLVVNPIKKERQLKIKRIDELRILLSDEDYKIIKCTEALALGQPMPYDLADLASRRDAYRSEINNLQEELNLN